MSSAGGIASPGSRQLARFLVVGLSNFILSFAAFMAANRWLPDFDGRAGTSQMLSFATGILWSFLLNRSWVFHSHAGDNAFIRFVSLQLLLLAATSLAIEAASRVFPDWQVVNWFAVMAVSTVVNFLLMRIWVFPSTTRHV